LSIITLAAFLFLFSWPEFSAAADLCKFAPRAFNNDGGISLGLGLELSKALSTYDILGKTDLSFNLKGNLGADGKTGLNDYLNADLKLKADRLWNDQYLYFAVIGGLESDQTLTTKQYYYGAKLGFSPRLSAGVSRFNIFDWPSAAYRWASREDKTFSPIGAMPTFYCGYDLVDPSSGVVKDLHKSDTAVPRLKLEASYQAPLSFANQVFVAFDLRYYKETNPTAAVIAAQMDRFKYFSVALNFSGIIINEYLGGPYIGYKTGTLPLDAKNDHILEAGINFTVSPIK
jgi:hypothetical protein